MELGIPAWRAAFAAAAIAAPGAGRCVFAQDGSAADAAMDADAARLAAAYSNCLSRIDRPAEGVSVPVETHANGAVKIEVFADKAQFFDKEGLVWCSGVTLREYSESGERRLELSAPACVIDRKTKSGWLEGRAAGRYGRTSIAGAGVWFSAQEEAVKVFSGVEVASSGIKLEGLKL